MELSKPRLYLCKPNREIIAELNEVYEINHNLKIGSVSELHFKLPYEIEIENELKRNKHVDMILYKYLIKYTVDDYTEWFVIENPEPSMGEDIDFLQVECYSLPYELNDKLIKSYKVESKTLTSIMIDLLKETTWNIGYVNAKFDTMYRALDIPSAKVLDAVLRCATTFGAIIKWNTENKEINFYLPEQIGTYKGLNFNYGKYLKSLNQSLDLENFCTRLKIYGRDQLTIAEVSPTGSSYLDDFSFFMHPYEEDADGNVIFHSDYMSDELCSAILKYNELLKENNSVYEGYLNDLSQYKNELTLLYNDLTSLIEEIYIIQDDKGIAQSSNNYYDNTISYSKDNLVIYNGIPYKCLQTSKGNLPTNTIYWENIIVKEQNKQIEIDNKNDDILIKQAQIRSVNLQIINLGDILNYENNFTPDQIKELNDYIIVKEVTNEYIFDAKELLDWGKSEFKKINTPQILIDIDIINFEQYLDEDCQLDKGKLILGDIVNIRHDKLGINVDAKMIELNYDYENNNVRLTLSNIETINKDKGKVLKQIDQSVNTSTEVNMEKFKWNKIIKTSNDVDQILNNVWDASLKQIKAGGSNEDITIDHQGITLTDPNDPLKAMRLMHSVLGLTQDGFNTLGVAIDASGVHAERLIGRIIAGEKLAISSKDGSFEVYENAEGKMQVDINNGALNIIGGLPPSQISQEYTDYIETQINEANGAIVQLEKDIGNILSDEKLTALEANTLEISLAQVLKESVEIINVATSLGIVTETDDYSNALNALRLELNNWINQEEYPIDITINQRDDILLKFETVQDTKSKLINAINLTRDENIRDYIEQQSGELSDAINLLENNINDFSDDLKMTLVESNSLEISLNNVISESADMINVATSLGIVTETDDYSNALNTLELELNNWINQEEYPIDITEEERIRIIDYFKDVENKKSILINRIIIIREQNAKNSSVGKGELINGVKIDAPNGLVVTRSDKKARSILNATEGIKVQTRPTIISGEEDIYDWSNAIDKFYIDTDGNLKIKGFLDVGINNNVFKVDNNGIYSGNANFNYAPFKVDLSGNLTATSANIKGNIDCTSLKIAGVNILDSMNQILGSSLADSSVGASKLKVDELIVGDNIQMGANAYISWENVTNQPFIPRTASDVGARPNTWTPTASQVGALPTNWVGTTYIDSNGVYTGTIVANQINTVGLASERIYKQGSPNNYAVIGGNYCDFKLYNSLGYNYFTVYDSVTGAGALQDNQKTFLSFGGGYTRPQGDWDFRDCTNVYLPTTSTTAVFG